MQGPTSSFMQRGRHRIISIPLFSQNCEFLFAGLDYHSALGARCPTRPSLIARMNDFGEKRASLDGLFNLCCLQGLRCPAAKAMQLCMRAMTRRFCVTPAHLLLCTPSLPATAEIWGRKRKNYLGGRSGKCLFCFCSSIGGVLSGRCGEAMYTRTYGDRERWGSRGVRIGDKRPRKRGAR